MKRYLILAAMAVLAQGCSTWKLGSSGQKKIEGRTYVIVGALSGIGRGVAEELGRCKANVVIAARRTEVLNEVAAVIRNAGGRATVVAMDISKPQDVQRVADSTLQSYGKIDVWINMAGVGAIGKFWDIPDADMSRLIDINLKGFIYGSKIAVQQFRKQGYGVLVNLGSVDSETPHAYQAAYSASKAGIRSLGLALSQELRLNGYKRISIVTVEPWAVDTPFWTHAANYSGVEQKFALMDAPSKVVNAILRKSLRPKKIVPVGWKAKGSSFFANVLPRFNERLTGNVAHKYQMEMPPAAPDTAGAIYSPSQEGTGVDGGVDEKMGRDREARKDENRQ